MACRIKTGERRLLPPSAFVQGVVLPVLSTAPLDFFSQLDPALVWQLLFYSQAQYFVRGVNYSPYITTSSLIGTTVPFYVAICKFPIGGCHSSFFTVAGRSWTLHDTPNDLTLLTHDFRYRLIDNIDSHVRCLARPTRAAPSSWVWSERRHDRRSSHARLTFYIRIVLVQLRTLSDETRTSHLYNSACASCMRTHRFLSKPKSRDPPRKAGSLSKIT